MRIWHAVLGFVAIGIRDQKMDLVKLSLERAVRYYAKYQKQMHSDVTIDILDMLVA